MAATKLRIALDWTPNTIHSGLFLAAEKGIYKEHNLIVELVPPDAQYSKTPAKQLEDGEVDLAICPSESCIAYNESGKMRLQAIYAILQKDASAIFSSKLNSMKELGEGKIYGSYNARYEDKIVEAMVEKDGGNGSGIKIERSEGKLSMFEAVKAGRIDATWIFLPWEGVAAEMEGVQARSFKLADYGIPYGYSPVIARNADKSPSDEILKAFVLATRKGYQHAMKDSAEAVDVLQHLTEPRREKDFLQRSQVGINQYYSDGRAHGLMDAAKWTTWLQWLGSRNLIAEMEDVKASDVFTNAFVD